MHRVTPMNVAWRVHSAGGARTQIDEADDAHLMQESKGDMFKNESRGNMESPQNYGFTSVVMPADKDKQGNIETSAEGYISYMGGGRSHPVVGVMDDRRHRLKELAPGDSAMYRTKDDRQQFHLVGEDKKDKNKMGGNFMSCRDDRCQRFALVPKPDDDKQQKAGPVRAGGGEQQQDGGKKKPTGQKSALDDNRKSEIAIEQNGTTTFSQHGQAYSSQKGGSDATVHWEKDKKISHQVTELHTHIRYKDIAWLWNDKEGNWMMPPLLVKKDLYCKEG